jgi:hypothetical protein
MRLAARLAARWVLHSAMRLASRSVMRLAMLKAAAVLVEEVATTAGAA